MVYLYLIAMRQVGELGAAVLECDWKTVDGILSEGFNAASHTFNGQPPQGFEVLIDWLDSEERVNVSDCREIWELWPPGVFHQLRQNGASIAFCLNSAASRTVLLQLEKRRFHPRDMTNGGRYAYAEAFDFMEAYTFLHKVLLKCSRTPDKILFILSK